MNYRRDLRFLLNGPWCSQYVLWDGKGVYCCPIDPKNMCWISHHNSKNTATKQVHKINKIFDRIKWYYYIIRSNTTPRQEYYWCQQHLQKSRNTSVHGVSTMRTKNARLQGQDCGGLAQVKLKCPQKILGKPNRTVEAQKAFLITINFPHHPHSPRK